VGKVLALNRAEAVCSVYNDGRDAFRPPFGTKTFRVEINVALLRGNEHPSHSAEREESEGDKAGADDTGLPAPVCARLTPGTRASHFWSAPEPGAVFADILRRPAHTPA